MKKRGGTSLSYITLFSGAGIGCFGFKKAGFKCLATCELLENRMQFQRYNEVCDSTSGYIAADISLDSTKKKIMNEIKKNNIRDVDVVIATPPCQGMSVANHKKKNEIRRNSLVVESIKIVDNILPKYFIFENVKSFLKTKCLDLDGNYKTIHDAITSNLSQKYKISSKVLNFKDYGVPSSRTRTVVIGVRNDIKASPDNLFPSLEKVKTLRSTIGDLPSLKTFGEINKKDFLHNFREYDKKMIDWIKDIKEGQTAFDNKEISKRPHQKIGNKIVPNKNKNGDKYKRNYWDKVAPCIHTRNDIFASQSTIHPIDNRVFSIRELMEIMTIPKTFKWFDIPYNKINNMELSAKKELLYSKELDIRRSIGEAVPTKIFYKIASNIKNGNKIE